MEAFVESLNGDIKDIDNLKFVSIGPVTSKTMEEYGMNVDIEAKVFTSHGIIDSLKGE